MIRFKYGSHEQTANMSGPLRLVVHGNARALIMVELADGFSNLNPDFQKVIQVAQETHRINVTPLMELKGGKTGANIYLVSVSWIDSKKVHHFVLKLDYKNTKTRMDEMERHRIAMSDAPSGFSRDHIPEMGFDRIETGNTVAIFYKIAGHSLHQYIPLSGYRQQDPIEKLFRLTNELLLTDWNAHPEYVQAVHPGKVLSTWLGYRLHPGGNIEDFIHDHLKIPQETEGLLIQDRIFPNPWLYACNETAWGDTRPIDTIVGFQHGDLNTNNILARFNENSREPDGFYLIDFALFKPHMPLFYDLLYLQVSYLIHELSRVPFPVWVDLVTQFAEKDILDTHRVPVEMAGVVAGINAGRTAFKEWVNSSHVSLSDDLWGQYWLAGVAAGLNYCNKTIISERERLAGFIFAAAHLKRYHHMFGVALPEEVRRIRIKDDQEPTSQGGSTEVHIPKQKVIKLPSPSSALIGRERETGELSEILKSEGSRLLTLTGPGGTGKTRLAIQLAYKMSELFRDGVVFIDLSLIREPESLYALIARKAELKESGDQSVLEELVKQLKDKQLLLLLDNFEQLGTSIPGIVQILENCPRLKLLVTSREALRIRGEKVFRVFPLANQDSVQLFKERAAAVRPDFEITEQNAHIISSICARLDGLPLAIELAVARINLFSEEELLKRLNNRMKFLRGGPRDLPERQQTIEHTLDWSYELLDNSEKQLFALCSVFHTCSIDEVETVAEGVGKPDDAQTDVIDVLNSLVEKSLIRVIDQDDGKHRLQMLETIREYALAKLAEDPEFHSLAMREHATFYADFAQQQWKSLTGRERHEVLRDFEVNTENVQLAWQFWVAEKDLSQLRKLTDSLWMLYDARGWFSSIAELTNDLIRVTGSMPSSPETSRQEIVLQTSLGRVMMSLKGCTPEVEGIFGHALELCEKYGEIPVSFPILRAMASFYAYVGNMERCRHFGEQIFALADQLDDPYMKVEGHLLMGFTIAFSGDMKAGMDHLEKGIAIYRPDLSKPKSFRFGSNPGLICFTTSAICSWMLGDAERSNNFIRKTLAMIDELDHPSSKIYGLFHTGLLHHFKREHEAAIKYAETALRLAEDHDFQIWQAVLACLHGASLAHTGQVKEGWVEFSGGLEKYAELKTPPIFWPMLLMIKAGVLIEADRFDDASDTLEESLAILGSANGNPLLSELYRLKGEVMLLISPDTGQEAEKLFAKALEIADKHSTATYGLRAAISLARLWEKNNKTDQIRELIQDALNRISGNLATVELKEAESLLNQLEG